MEIVHEIAVRLKDRVLVLDRDLEQRNMDVSKGSDWYCKFHCWHGRHYKNLKQGPGWSFPVDSFGTLENTVENSTDFSTSLPPNDDGNKDETTANVEKTTVVPLSHKEIESLVAPKKLVPVPMAVQVPAPKPALKSVPPPPKPAPTPPKSAPIVPKPPKSAQKDKPFINGYEIDLPGEIRKYFRHYEEAIFSKH